MIIALSDLHLECSWSVSTAEKLNDFIVKLASVAEVGTQYESTQHRTEQHSTA